MKAESMKFVRKFDRGEKRNGQFILSWKQDSQSWLRLAKFARLNGRRSEVGWLIFQRMSMKPETFLTDPPFKRLSFSLSLSLSLLRKRERRKRNKTLLRGPKRTWYYLIQPRTQNIVSNGSPFLTHAQINGLFLAIINFLYVCHILQFWVAPFCIENLIATK